ncbi:MAG: hypothetical protein NT098_03925 [Candidatus Parcubacteria bacterium]|nr:hypothetical protein [Candidatus Parcubacteria bacterium]
MEDKRLDQAVLRDFSFTKTAPTISGGTLTLDISAGNVFEVSLNANIATLNITNPSPSGNACKFDLILTADGTARTIAWPAAVQWSGGGAYS